MISQRPWHGSGQALRATLPAHAAHDAEEVDGPMLRYGLQALHGNKIHAPRSPELRPRREFLEERYERFRKAG